MRRILVDEARRRKTEKRGKSQKPVPLDDLGETAQGHEEQQDPFEDLDALDGALNKLETLSDHKRKCSVVELRFFVGLTLEETAQVLGVSQATVQRDWEFTKAWLSREMSSSA